MLFPTDRPKVTQVTQFHAALIPLQYQKRKLTTRRGLE
jgi:hypothetical protein